MTTLNQKMRIFRAYRQHRDDPEPFYQEIADSTASMLHSRFDVTGQRVLDLGCGPGWYLDALRKLGADAWGVERDSTELADRTTTVRGALLADGTTLPFPDGTFDGVLCSNMLEHTPHPGAILDDIARVLRPNGWAYVSWTPWYSPWGGHDMNPYQYLGPRLGPKLYERRNGPPRKNRYGDALWAAHVGDIVRLARAHPTLGVERVEARYWPKLSVITRVPLLREIATGNCGLTLRVRPLASSVLAQHVGSQARSMGSADGR